MSTATEPRPATLDELKARHAKTPAQAAALRAADQHLFEAHPGEYVAYTDEWDGDALHREVVAHARTVGAFHAALAALPPEMRTRAEVTQLPEVDALDVPSVELL
jgi:hypothetical protein